VLELASKLGRQASGMDASGGEKTGPAVRVEVNVALAKIYGQPVPGEVLADGPVVDVEGVKGQSGKQSLLASAPTEGGK